MSSRNETAHSILEVGRTGEGFVVRVGGRGSVHESPGLKAFVVEALEAGPTSDVTVDLSECDYLDSTFQGCLLGLHAKFNAADGQRVRVAGPDDKLHKLFGPSGLEKVLPRSAESAPAVQEWLAVPAAELDRNELGQHLIDCHRRLANLGGPDAENFAAIADQLETELSPARR